MKNLYLMPTDNKYSRLYFNVNDKEFQICKIEKPSTILKPNRHIYITNDEEIKVGDWTLMFDDLGNLFLCDKPQQYLGIEKGHHLNKGLKKIILTTDQDLIKDGVQAIEDEFLGWFVKNPNCESVDVESMFNVVQFTSREFIYKIIIPKEEPKQETLEEAADLWSIDANNVHPPDSYIAKKGFLEGAKWQSERMYSEEEIDLLNKMFELYWYENNNEHEDNLEEWELSKKLFKQFKKK